MVNDDMTNARTEFIQHIKSREVLCAKIRHGYHYMNDVEDEEKAIILTKGFTKEEYNDFLQSLDFTYDAGYGGQELFGNIWYTDGTWSDRYEYDGSECWSYQRCPEIPKELNRIDKVRDQKIDKIINND